MRSIAAVPTLQFLYLRELRNVTKLPSFAPLRALRRVDLETMKGLTNLRPVAKAPALEDLMVVGHSQLDPKAFRPFVGHPTLQRALVAIGSMKRNEAIEQLLGLPKANRDANDFVFDEAGNDG